MRLNRKTHILGKTSVNNFLKNYWQKKPLLIKNAIAKGYTFIIASSDLFVLNSWAEGAEKLVKKYSNAQ